MCDRLLKSCCVCRLDEPDMWSEDWSCIRSHVLEAVFMEAGHV